MLHTLCQHLRNRLPKSHQRPALCVLACVACAAMLVGQPALVAALVVAQPAGRSAFERETTHELIDRNLVVMNAIVDTIEDDQVLYHDNGLRRYRATSDLLALICVDSTIEASSGQGVIELVDGQRLIGRLAMRRRSYRRQAAPDPNVIEDENDSEIIAWENDFVGRFEFELDRVARIVFPVSPSGFDAWFDEEELTNPSQSRAQRSMVHSERFMRSRETATLEADVVLLANGDRVSGYVISCTDGLITIEDDSGDIIELPIERVRELTLLNERERPSGQRILGTDGSEFVVNGVRLSGDYVHAEMPERGTIRISGSFVRGILFDAAAFQPLATSPLTRLGGPNWYGPVDRPRRLDIDAAFGASDIELRGPVEMEFELPDASGRFVTIAEIPRTHLDWADLIISVHLDDTVISRTHLHRDQPREEIVIDFERGREMLITLEEGERGPVQDVVVLRRPMLRIDK